MLFLNLQNVDSQDDKIKTHFTSNPHQVEESNSQEQDSNWEVDY